MIIPLIPNIKFPILAFATLPNPTRKHPDMDPEKLSTRRILQRNLSRRLPPRMEGTKLLLHNFRSLHNVGAAFRSADAFGVSEILLSGYTPAPPRPEITKTAIGAEEHVAWSSHEDAREVLPRLREEGYLLMAFEQTTGSRPLPGLRLPGEAPLCLVFGNEVAGLDEDLLPGMDLLAEIPQYGHKHSLNVSVTVGVALYGLLAKCWEEGSAL